MVELRLRKKIHVSLEYEGRILDSYDLVEIVKNYHIQLGLTVNKINAIQPKFVAVPGHVYNELGIASASHPTGGSIGVFIQQSDGLVAELQPIFYHDRNPWRTHEGGKPHWNQEIRLIDTSGKEHMIRGKYVKGIKNLSLN